MTPANTEDRWKRRRRSAVRGVVLFGLLQVACAVCFGSLCFIPDLPKWAFALFLALTVFCLLLILPALLVLKKRFEEIQGGEEDAAAEY